MMSIFFWFSRLDWDPEMRLWRAVGDAGWMLFWFSLITGPLARIWTRKQRISFMAARSWNMVWSYYLSSCISDT